jgi:hypothetical protein
MGTRGLTISVFAKNGKTPVAALDEIRRVPQTSAVPETPWSTILNRKKFNSDWRWSTSRLQTITNSLDLFCSTLLVLYSTESQGGLDTR